MHRVVTGRAAKGTLIIDEVKTCPQDRASYFSGFELLLRA